MTFEPEKFLQNIELKLGGRTAFLAIGLVVLAFVFWVLMKGYSEHPLLSTIGGSVLLVAILSFLVLGLVGKSRPEEDPRKSLTQVTQMGIVIAQGLGSHKDMVQIMREHSGITRLPPPTHEVRGSAANRADYIPLSPEQSSKLIDSIEQGIERMLQGTLTNAVGHQLQERNPEEEQGASTIKGKKLSD